jgi:hypothetical protein
MRIGLVLSSVAAVTVALGACSSSEAPPEGQAPPLTFAQAIEPLLQDKCQQCHSEGGVAPFSLVTYEQVTGMAAAARQKVLAREMPPWGAFDDETCEMRHPIKDDLRLTDEQIDMFVRWVDDGMPLGDTSRRPAPRTFSTPVLEGRTHTFAMNQPFEVAATGKDDIRCFPVDPGFDVDTWIGGTNVVPGDPSVVHHVIVYVDPNREGITKSGADGSYPCFGGPEVSNPSLLMAWAPGVTPASFGEDAGIKVPKDAHLVLQVHYHPGAATAFDATAFELSVLPYKPSFVSQMLLIGNAEHDRGLLRLLPGPNDPPEGPAFVIPPNAKGHTESMEVTIPEQVNGGTLPPMSIMMSGAHMHWAGVDMKIDIERKAPTSEQPARECLLGTPKYDFNWQRGYVYDVPVEALPLVSPGDTLRFTCTYDNTIDNPHVRRAMAEQRLSSPPEIRLGESTLDEMCLGVLLAVRPATVLD